ncbi:hypothetical protein [Haloferax sp. DFSO52]|uniref:hypothetical protein n=1 Tax=Haloferax sp. DFSO52 TaxID=3388505 RepID=UPI003A8683C3
MAQYGSNPLAEGAETRMVRIEREMNDHGAMMVRVVETGELRTMVEYTSLHIHDRLEQARVGMEMPLQMTHSPGRGNAWVVFG